MGIQTKSLWNVKSASAGGDWVLDAWGGLLDGVIYVDRRAIATRNPSTVTAYLSDRSSVETDVPDFTIGDLTVTRLPGFSTSTLIAYHVQSEGRTAETRGLWQVDAQYTIVSETEGDFYTKDQINGLISQGVSDSENYTDRQVAVIKDNETELRKEVDGIRTSLASTDNVVNSNGQRLFALETAVESMSRQLTTLSTGSLSIVEQGTNSRGSWLKFSNGAMKQWGVGQSNPYGNLTQLFATSFPKRPNIVQAIMAYSTATNENRTGSIRIDDNSTTTVSFAAQTRDIAGNGANTTVSGVASKFYWFAEYWPDAVKAASDETTA